VDKADNLLAEMDIVQRDVKSGDAAAKP
jgi:hypothetical protein